MRRIEVDGVPVCVIHTDDDEFFAIDDTCSHGQSSLSNGWLDGRTLECVMHGSVFDVTTGRPLNFPATIPIRIYRVVVDGEDLVVSTVD